MTEIALNITKFKISLMGEPLLNSLLNLEEEDNELTSNGVEIFDTRANLILKHIENQNTGQAIIAKELSQFFSIAELFVTAEQNQGSIDEFKNIITKVSSTVLGSRNKKHVKKAITISLIKKMFLVSALSNSTPTTLTVDRRERNSPPATRQPPLEIPWSQSEREQMQRYVQNLVSGPLKNLLKLAGAEVKKPRDIFRENLSYRFWNTPQAEKRLELAAKLILGMKETIDIRGGPARAGYEYSEAVRILGREDARMLYSKGIKEGRSYVGYLREFGVKPEIYNAIADAISKILIEYVSTTNNLYIYRGAHFETREQRDSYLEELKQKGITFGGVYGRHLKFISTSAFRSAAERFGHSELSPYGVIVTIDFSKVRKSTSVVRYDNVESDQLDSKTLRDRVFGEFRVKIEIPPDAIITAELIDPVRAVAKRH